jgi:hypothetical protein
MILMTIGVIGGNIFFNELMNNLLNCMFEFNKLINEFPVLPRNLFKFIILKVNSKCFRPLLRILLLLRWPPSPIATSKVLGSSRLQVLDQFQNSSLIRVEHLKRQATRVTVHPDVRPSGLRGPLHSSR